MNNTGKTAKTEVPYAKAVVIPPNNNSEGTPLLEVPSGSPADLPGVGRWKDGLCSCFRFGLCHPSLLSACCIPQLLMAQVLNRVSLDYLGRPIPTTTTAESKTKTFRTILGIVIAYYVFYLLLACPPAMVEMKDNDDDDDADIDLDEVASITDTCPTWQRSLNQVVSLAMFVYTVVVMTRLRKAVRSRYHIPTNYDTTNLEDCCYVTWCGCCTVSQLARQTADYDVFAAHCCSTNGLSAAQEDAIALVV